MRATFRIYAAIVTIASATCLAIANWDMPVDTARFANALGAFAVLCFVSEAYYFRLRVGRTETQSSVAFIPYIASFLIFAPGWAALVTSVSMLAVEFGVRRKPAYKIVFNTAQVALSICVA